MLRHKLATAHTSLGKLLGRSRDASAGAEFQKALALRVALLADFPEQAGHKYELERLRIRTIDVMGVQGQPAQAEARLLQACKYLAGLAKRYPSALRFREDLALGRHNLGRVLQSRKRNAEAEVEYRAALDSREKLLADFPDNPNMPVGVAATHGSIAELLMQSGKADQALKSLEQAVSVLEKARKRWPADLEIQPLFVGVLIQQGRALTRLERHAEAASARARAARLAPPRQAVSLQIDAAHALARAGTLDQAAAEARELAKNTRLTARQCEFLARVFGVCAGAHGTRPEQAEVYARQAVELLKRANALGGEPSAAGGPCRFYRSEGSR